MSFRISFTLHVFQNIKIDDFEDDYDDDDKDFKPYDPKKKACPIEVS